MNRRDFITGLLKSAPAIIVAGVAVVTSELMTKKRVKDIIKFTQDGKEYRIKADAFERVK